MTYHNSVKQEYEQPNGIRRTEFRYSGDIDTSGKLKLKRCVGKSFLDKSREAGDLPTGANMEHGADKKTVYPVLPVQPDKSA